MLICDIDCADYQVTMAVGHKSCGWFTALQDLLVTDNHILNHIILVHIACSMTLLIRIIQTFVTTAIPVASRVINREVIKLAEACRLLANNRCQTTPLLKPVTAPFLADPPILRIITSQLPNPTIYSHSQLNSLLQTDTMPPKNTNSSSDSNTTGGAGKSTNQIMKEAGGGSAKNFVEMYGGKSCKYCVRCQYNEMLTTTFRRSKCLCRGQDHCRSYEET
jgi:hypothetical protein